jgi:formate hydrogenlyase subunit 6/NADH:ubiquinone oxidoreductase subunit I
MKMLPTVLSNLFARPATRDYPAVVRESFPQARGELVNDISRCIFCGLCARKCPSQCLTVAKDKAEGVWTLEFFACVGCGVCVEVCPVHCLAQKPTHRPVALARAVIALRGPLPEKPAKQTNAPGTEGG